MARVFSGVQPTGALHLGNYLGAIKRFATMQDEHDCLFCVVDQHAITQPYDRANLRIQSRAIAAAYMACGVDPAKATIFIQSSVREHAELTWILSCIARMGWLERMTQFKDKSGVDSSKLQDALARTKTVLDGGHKDDMWEVVSPADLRVLYEALARSNSEGPSVGLFTYPILMAADILAYQANLVPVGADQKQHLELARDIAKKFNKDMKTDFFPLPRPLIHESTARIMSLQDASRKMSKSDPDPNSTIGLFDTNDQIANKIRRATADTQPIPETFEGMKAEVENLIGIYAALSSLTKAEVLEQFAGKGYGVFKPALTDVVIATVEPIRTATQNLLADPKMLDLELHHGAAKARAIAAPNLAIIRELVGFQR